MAFNKFKSFFERMITIFYLNMIFRIVSDHPTNILCVKKNIKNIKEWFSLIFCNLE